MDRSLRFQRRAGFGGVKYKARLEPAEAVLLREVVGAVKMMLSDRLESGEQDELAQLTGMTTGSAQPPAHAPLARLVPDFFAPPAAIDGTADPSVDAEADAAAREGERERENAAMRMLHEPEIVETKLTASETVLRTVPVRGGTVSLDEDQAFAWITALNDVRLVLGEVLIRHAHPETGGAGGGMRPGEYRGGVPEERPDPDSPLFPSWQAYYWTSMMQDDLVQAMM